MSAYDNIVLGVGISKSKAEDKEVLINQTVSILKEFVLHVLTKLRDSIDPKLEIVKYEDYYEVVGNDKKIRFEFDDNPYLLNMELCIQYDGKVSKIVNIYKVIFKSILCKNEIEYELKFRNNKTRKTKTYNVYFDRDLNVNMTSDFPKRGRYAFSLENLIKLFEQS
jgi:hypothetical protein